MFKFVQDDHPEGGDQDDDCAEGDNTDEHQAFADAGLDFPQGPDGEDDDEDVDEYILLLSDHCEPLVEVTGSTYEGSRKESQDGFVQTLYSWVSRWMKVCIQGYALQAVNHPGYDDTECVQDHGGVDQISEDFGVSETKVEQQECHLYYPVNPDVIHLFNEKSLWKSAR